MAADLEKNEAVTTTAAMSTQNVENETKQQQCRQVRFSKATYYEHYGIMGDNPACSRGFPLSIDWACADMYVLDLSLDLSEGDLVHNINESPRSKEELRLSAMDREYRLIRRLGYTRHELVELCKPVNLIRAQRQRTIETLAMEPVQSLFQNVFQKVVKKPANAVALLQFLSRHKNSTHKGRRQQEKDIKRFMQGYQQQQQQNQGAKQKHKLTTGESVDKAEATKETESDDDIVSDTTDTIDFEFSSSSIAATLNRA